MSTAGPIVADLRAESDELDAIVAGVVVYLVGLAAQAIVGRRAPASG
jgi:hypothetical protein